MTSSSPSSNPHIVASYEAELQSLRASVAELGEAAACQLENAVVALMAQDADLARQVIDGDKEVDRLDEKVEHACLRILALRQPYASDLRLTLTTVKVANEIERVGDFAKNIAKRAITLSDGNKLTVQPFQSIPHLKDMAVALLRDAVSAYIDRDADLAVKVWQADKPLDVAYTALFRETLSYMLEDSRTITPCTHLLFVAKNLERVGDHATNIAEFAYFLTTGTYLTGDRPKGDLSTAAVPKEE